MEERQALSGEHQRLDQVEELPRGEVEPTEAGETISKRRQKKLLRLERNKELQDVKRKQEKEKRKANRLKLKLAGIDLGKEKREANARPKKVSSARIVIDLSFDELMTEKVHLK